MCHSSRPRVPLLTFVFVSASFEKRHSTLSAHCSPAFRVKEGDVVTVGQCRPLSKTVRFNVLKVESATEAGAIQAKKTFRVF
mgnify:CR=1 FL=1